MDVVSRWRGRFATEGLAGLGDRKRTGRPRSFPAEVVAEVKAMACEPPEHRGAPLCRWSSAELAREAVAEGLVEAVSASSVRRWLAADAIKPWQHRSWIFPRDPHFGVKAARVLDLYARVWQGLRARRWPPEPGRASFFINQDRSCLPRQSARPRSWLARTQMVSVLLHPQRSARLGSRSCSMS